MWKPLALILVILIILGIGCTPGHVYTPEEALTRVQSKLGSTEFASSAELICWAYGIPASSMDELIAQSVVIWNYTPGALVFFIRKTEYTSCGLIDKNIDGVLYYFNVTDGVVQNMAHLITRTIQFEIRCLCPR